MKKQLDCEYTKVANEALNLIKKSRQEDYGSIDEMSKNVVAMWNCYLNIATCEEIKPEDFNMMMIILKLVRQRYKYKKDNLVDIIGYALLSVA